MYESIHERIRNSFDVEDWKGRLTKAKEHRHATWDYIAERCINIRDGKTPEGRFSDFDDPTGRMFKGHLCYQVCKFLVSDIAGSDVIYDLECEIAIRDENTEVLEVELNTIAARLDINQKTMYTFYDCLYTGMGYVRRWWNKKKCTLAYKTGQPELDYVPTMNVYIDENTRDPNKCDMNYIFHVEKYHWQKLCKDYPHMKEQFKQKKDRNGMVEIAIVQFKVKEIIKSVVVSDTAHEVPQEWIYPAEEWTAMIDSGKDAPEQVEVSKEFDCEKNFWYEARFFPDIKEVIQKPIYVGEMSSYHIISYSPQKDSAYSVGLVYYLIDMEDINTYLITTLIKQTIRYQKQEKEIVYNALVNFREYLDHGYKLGVNPIVKEEWAKENPGRQAVTMMPLGDFPGGIQYIVDFVENKIKNVSGVTDTVQGNPTVANQSGVSVAQLQAAGKVYHEEERLKFMRLAISIGYGLLADIDVYRSGAHAVNYLDEHNVLRPVMVNDPSVNSLTFEVEKVILYCVVPENIELLKQMKKEEAYAQYDRGLISGFRVLEASDTDNASRKYAEALEEQGMKRIFEFLQTNPQAMQLFEQLMQSGMQQGGQLQLSGGEVPDATTKAEDQYVGRNANPE